MEVVKDGEPDNGMGYPGKYRVRNASGMETVVSRQDLGGFMLLGKGWPPAFMEHVETPDRSMLLVGGELGGLIEYFCASRTAVSFEGGQAMEMAGETTRGVVSACSAWDASGAFVVISTRRQGSSVYDWETRKHHGNLPSSQKSHSRFAFLPGASDAARVAAWEAGGLIAWDVRALVRVWQVSLEIPVTSFVGAEHQLFTYQFTKGAPLGRLSLWCTQSLENVRAESLDFGPVEYITSMLLLPTVGLLTAHMPISVGILVWDPTTGDRSVYPDGDKRREQSPPQARPRRIVRAVVGDQWTVRIPQVELTHDVCHATRGARRPEVLVGELPLLLSGHIRLLCECFAAPVFRVEGRAPRRQERRGGKQERSGCPLAEALRRQALSRDG